MSSVQDSVFDIIAKESGVDRSLITPEATLKDLKIESLDAVQIIFEIEDHFKITLPDRDPNFDTESVKGLVEAVEKLVAENKPRRLPRQPDSHATDRPLPSTMHRVVITGMGAVNALGHDASATAGRRCAKAAARSVRSRPCRENRCASALPPKCTVSIRSHTLRKSA